jgi:hypothetical protein
VTSAGSDAGVGVIGINALHVRVESPVSGACRDYDFSVRATPVGWRRSNPDGSNAWRCHTLPRV